MIWKYKFIFCQYRAMFVINCTVLTDQKLKFPVTKKAKKGKGKGR